MRKEEPVPQPDLKDYMVKDQPTYRARWFAWNDMANWFEKFLETVKYV